MREKTTKYQRLVRYIRDLIQDGAVGPGDKLASENELCEMFGISRQTVRRALHILEEEGLLCSRRGSGTYVEDGRTGRGGGSNRIAVITTYVDSYIFPKTIQGVEQILSEKGYAMQVAFTNNAVEREKSVLEDIINRDEVAGIIVEGTKSGLPNPNLNLYRRLAERKIPILFINAYYPELGAPHISLDDAAAARKAVNYLTGRGHRRIGAVLKLDDGQGRLRYLGYLRGMEDAGLTVRDSDLVWIDTEESRQLGFCIDKIKARLGSCTAVLCYNDQIAFRLIPLLQSRGIRVPEQLSVISIDDSDLALHSEVPITSLPHPKERLGAMAAGKLLEMIRGSRDAQKGNITYEFDTRVVERASVADMEEYNKQEEQENE